MNPHRLVFSTFALCIVSLTFAAAAQAQPQRTFVSAQNGLDTNPCTVTQPCRNFNQAISVVRSGGEVVALDSGGYGPVTITKAVTVTGPSGVYVAITAQTTDAVTVSAGESDAVVLKGLTIRGLLTSSTTPFHGINLLSGSVLHVEGCTISGFTNTDSAGIRAHSSTAGGSVFVKDSTVRGNAYGIHYSSAGKLYVSGSNVQNNSADGIRAAGVGDTAHVFIEDTRADNNTGAGMYLGAGSSPVKAAVSRSTASGNDCGICTGSDSPNEITVSESTFAGNNVGLSVNLGVKANVFMSTAANNVSYGFMNISGELNLEDCVARGNNIGVLVNGGDSLARMSNTIVTNNDIGIRIGTLGEGPRFVETRQNNTVSGNTTDVSGGTLTPISGT